MPRSLLMTVLATSATGLAIVLSLLFSLPDPARIFDPDTVTGGSSAVLQIAWDVFMVRDAGDVVCAQVCGCG